MIDVRAPIVTKDAQGDPVVTIEVTKDGQPYVTSVTYYHDMSEETLADMGKTVYAFFDKVKHLGLTPKEFGAWEDKSYKMIAKYRNAGHGSGRKGAK